METKNLRVYKNTNYGYDAGNAEFFIVNQDAVETTPLCECYNNYGQHLGCTDAGCNTFANEYSNITSEFLDEFNEKFNLNLEDIRSIENEEEFKDMLEEEGIEFLPELLAFYKAYKDENEEHTEVEAITYSNGSKLVSLVKENEFFDSCDFEEIDSELENEILKAAEKYDTYIDNGFSKSEDIGKYTFSNSRNQNDFAIAWVEVNILH